VAPVRLRSRIAGLLRRAAETLDRSPSPTSPVVPPAARRPGEPPEHWLRTVRDRAPGLLAGEGIGLQPPSSAVRLGRAADPASLRWPADPRPGRPAPFPSDIAPAVRRLREPVPVEPAVRTTPRLPTEPPVPRPVAAPRSVAVAEPERQEPLAVPEFPVDRPARVVVPRFPVDRRGRFVVPEFPPDPREPLTPPEFPAEETVAVDAPAFPDDVAAARPAPAVFPVDRPGPRIVAAQAFPAHRRGTGARPGYPGGPAPVPAAGLDWPSSLSSPSPAPAPAQVRAAPAWPRLPEPHGRQEPAWPHPDPDPSRWPALPDDSPLWTVPGPSIDERRVRRLDAEQAGR
jgi:hypothetical protein